MIQYTESDSKGEAETNGDNDAEGDEYDELDGEVAGEAEVKRMLKTMAKRIGRTRAIQLMARWRRTLRTRLQLSVIVRMSQRETWRSWTVSKKRMTRAIMMRRVRKRG